nr:carboxypeptidase A5 isoform X3 [Microcebus murinus]
MQGTPGGGTCPRLPPLDRQTLLVFSFILAAALGQMNFTGDQVLRVLAKDEKQLSLLRDLEGLKPQKVDFWRSPARPSLPVDMRVSFSELKDVKAYLASHGLAYSIMIKDIQVLLDEEREAMARSRRLERSTSSFSYSSYHTLEEIYSWMDNFVTEHSDMVSKIRIGRSFENRTILVLKFSTGGSRRPAIWIDTGIHSREWITHATGIWTAKKNRLWRKNKSTRRGIFCIGVDLNRNWKSGFGVGAGGGRHCGLHHSPWELQGADLHPQLLSDAHVSLWPNPGACFKRAGDVRSCQGCGEGPAQGPWDPVHFWQHQQHPLLGQRDHRRLGLRQRHQVCLQLRAPGHGALWLPAASHADHPHSPGDVDGDSDHHGAHPEAPLLATLLGAEQRGSSSPPGPGVSPETQVIHPPPHALVQNP